EVLSSRENVDPFMVDDFMFSLKMAETVLELMLMAEVAGTVLLTVGLTVSAAAAVVNDQLLAVIVLPDRSFMPLTVTVTVLLTGSVPVKVTDLLVLFQVTAPPVAPVTEKFARVTVERSSVSLKSAVMLPLGAKPLVPFAGVVAVTAGAVLSVVVVGAATETVAAFWLTDVLIAVEREFWSAAGSWLASEEEPVDDRVAVAEPLMAVAMVGTVAAMLLPSVAALPTFILV